MPETQPHTLIRQLETTLRYTAARSNWLHLEPVNSETLESIETALSSLMKTPELSPRKAAPTERLNAVLHPEPTLEKQKEVPKETTIQEPQDMDPMQAPTLDSLRLRLRDCDRCNLCRERQKIVFGQGNIRAELVFIGEGPGADEDKSGIAFVGRAGKLLTQMIQSIGINRESVYICNVVKCRPPGNRNPTGDEIQICSPFMYKQLELLKPKLIVTMGNIATKTLLPHAYGIMKMRGKLTSFQGTPLLPTFHPSYLLRNPSALELVWNDMKHIRQILFQGKPPAAES